jgi:hypothetical protein
MSIEAMTSSNPSHPFFRRLLREALPDASIIIHVPPDVPSDVGVLGICGLSSTNASQDRYGWMVVDFLTWHHMLTALDGSSEVRHAISIALRDYSFS